MYNEEVKIRRLGSPPIQPSPPPIQLYKEPIPGKQIHIRKFDINKLFEPIYEFPGIISTHNIAIFGRRATGKTTLVCDILRHSKIENTIVVSPTESYKKQYEKIEPQPYIIEEYQDEPFEYFITNQKKVVKTYENACKSSEPPSIDPRAAIVFDNYDNGINNSQAKIAEDNKRLPDKSDPYFLTDDQIELLNW